MAIGDHILDLLVVAHLFNGAELSKHQHVFKEVCNTIFNLFSQIYRLLLFVNFLFQSTLNSFMDLGPSAWTEARNTIKDLLTAGKSLLEDNPELKKQYIIFHFRCYAIYF